MRGRRWLEFADGYPLRVRLRRSDTSEYATDALVSPDRLEARLDEFGSDDPEYRLIEAGIEYGEPSAEGHVPNAIGFGWGTHLQDSTQRDILKTDQFAEIMGKAGITEDRRSSCTATSGTSGPRTPTGSSGTTVTRTSVCWTVGGSAGRRTATR